MNNNGREKIQVTPFVPHKGYHNDALNMDFYELTMANAIYLLGMKDVRLVFDCFFRKNPGSKGKEMGYSISAGQEQLTDFLLNYHFDKIACEYLLDKEMDPGFVEYLSTYKWKGNMYAMPEGTVAYPNEAMVRIECDAVGAFLIETYLLQTMNFNSLITTKATSIVRATDNGKVMEFGGRRAQGASASLYGSRAAILGGCVGTANCLAEIVFGEPVKAMGTVAHAWVELFPTEYEAFRAQADIYPENVSLLIDTYNIFESGVINTLKVDDYLIDKYPDDPNKRVKSVRIDSGDLAYESKKLRKIFDEAGKTYIKIVASNGLDEESIRSMIHEQGAKIDSFGVGENLITAADCPVFGGVYKLVAVEGPDGWEPRMKCSNTLEKAIIPGYKMVYRLYDEDGYGYLDLIAMHDEVIEIGKPIKVYTTDLNDPRKEYTITPKVIKPLLVPHVVNGELVREMPTISEIREYIKDQLENQVWPEELRSSNPHRHFVDMTEKVYKLRSDMYQKLHG
jgi:nicotinate phosphoribosyltransferase